MTPEEKAAEEWADGEGSLWFADISVYTDGHKGAISQAFLAGIQWARENAGWFSLKERLPKNFGEYYVYVKNHRVELACFNGEEWSLTMTDGAGLEGDITHWMPLPPAPKQDGKK